MTRAVLAMCLAACWRDAPPPPTPPAPRAPDPLAIELVMSATSFAMADRAQLDVGVRATNMTNRSFDPRLDMCDLLVNGEASVDFHAAVGNGGRPPEWFKLPPGRSVELSFPLGESLFPHPGDYELVLVLDDIRAKPLHVRVRP